MTFGAKLAAARKRAGLTQEQLGEKVGVSFQAVSMWEHGDSMPDTGHLVALSETLEISLDRLLKDGIRPDWELKPPVFSAERMYTFVKARAQAEGMAQTLAALPVMREKHSGQYRKSKTASGIPYAVHPLTLACHALALGIGEDDLLAAALLHDVVEDTDTLPEELPVSARVQEAVRLVSYSTYLTGSRTWKEEIKDEYYAHIARNPLAAMVKCLDRCNNLSCMADGFSRARMAAYVTETERYVLPLLDVIRKVPAWNDAWWLLRYQIFTLLEAFKRLV